MPVETKSWPARDPDAKLDYVYTIPLDEGDSVASYSATELTGGGTLESDSRTGADVKVWLSGGEDGQTNVYRIAWTTDAGREDEAVITQLVVSNETAALEGYDKPGTGHFLQRYPAFASVPAGTIEYWLADAARFVDESWSQPDYAPGIMAYAAWQMARAGIGGSGSSLPAGVTRFRSGAMDVAISDSVASASLKGGVAASLYEEEFCRIRRRNLGGPRLVGCV